MTPKMIPKNDPQIFPNIWIALLDLFIKEFPISVCSNNGFIGQCRPPGYFVGPKEPDQCSQMQELEKKPCRNKSMQNCCGLSSSVTLSSFQSTLQSHFLESTKPQPKRKRSGQAQLAVWCYSGFILSIETGRLWYVAAMLVRMVVLEILVVLRQLSSVMRRELHTTCC